MKFNFKSEVDYSENFNQVSRCTTHYGEEEQGPFLILFISLFYIFLIESQFFLDDITFYLCVHDNYPYIISKILLADLEFSTSDYIPGTSKFYSYGYICKWIGSGTMLTLALETADMIKKINSKST